ncbi:MAG: PIN domain-containing protein [Firmicutes bacterium]|jgi:predicted nucleic acid-binding protein|nr:PIN domain-containing protein [Bacillota bacterium]
MPENKEFQFVDTNIIIYAYDISDPVKREQARSLIIDLWESGLGCLSIQVLQELYVNISAKIPKPLPADIASRIITDLGQWRLHIPDLSSILEAIEIQQRNQISFWDAMIICSAKTLDCKIIWTEDLNTNQFYENIKAVNPFL